MPDLNANDVDMAMRIIAGTRGAWAWRWTHERATASAGRPTRGLDREDEYRRPMRSAPQGLPDAKFDETVEVAFRLGVDPRKADQMVRGTVGCRTGPARASASRCSPQGRRRARRARPGPTWSAARSWSRRS